MKKPIAALTGAAVACAGIALSPVAAHAHGDNGNNKRIEVVKVVDTKKKDHSLVTVKYDNSMRGKAVKVTADSKLFAGIREGFGPWIKPSGGAEYYRNEGRSKVRTTLPRTGNRATIAIPFDVAKRPPTRFASKESDAIRMTFVTIVYKSQYTQSGQARIMTVRAGDPADYFMPGNRVSRLWDRGWDSDHAHRIRVR